MIPYRGVASSNKNRPENGAVSDFFLVHQNQAGMIIQSRVQSVLKMVEQAIATNTISKIKPQPQPVQDRPRPNPKLSCSQSKSQPSKASRSKPPKHPGRSSMLCLLSGHFLNYLYVIQPEWLRKWLTETDERSSLKPQCENLVTAQVKRQTALHASQRLTALLQQI